MKVTKTGIEITFKRSELNNIKYFNNWVGNSIAEYDDRDVSEFEDIEDLHDIFERLNDLLYELQWFINDRDNVKVNEEE